MDREARLLHIAGAQHSVFSRPQALRAGFSPKAIQLRTEAGRWRTLHRGVFINAGIAIGWQQTVWASLLACGSGAVASFASAAVIWPLAERLLHPHVTIGAAKTRRRRGIVVHRSDDLDGTTFRGFPVTHPMRTLLDLAGAVDEETLERYLDASLNRRLVSVNAFHGFLGLERNARRLGVGMLRAMLVLRQPGRAIGSDLETIFFRALRAAGLPLPVAQHPVMTERGLAYIDFAYPDVKLALELDGFERHGTRQVFEDDYERQAALEELGWRFRRFTWKQVRTDATGTAIRVGTALGMVPVRWRPPGPGRG
jgi:very-short-patch-repair endonuclease